MTSRREQQRDLDQRIDAVEAANDAAEQRLNAREVFDKVLRNPLLNDPAAHWPSPADFLDMPVRITRSAVFIGQYRMPGVIAQDGITLRPGGSNDCNRLTVEFLVGPVTADDPWVSSIKEQPSAPPPVTRYRSRQPQTEDVE